LNSKSNDAWMPGGFGFQKSDGVAMVAGAASAVGFPFRLDPGNPVQPFDSHFRRNLNWVSLDLWDLTLPSNSGSTLDIPFASRQFIEDLYRLEIDPHGHGWIVEP